MVSKDESDPEIAYERLSEAHIGKGKSLRLILCCKTCQTAFNKLEVDKVKKFLN